MIDDLALWSREMDENEVNFIYQHGVESFETGIIPEPATIFSIIAGCLMGFIFIKK